jgi:hypothetical protein
VPSRRKEMGPTCHTLDESRRERKKTKTKMGKCLGVGFRGLFFISKFNFSIFNNRLYIFQKFRIKISILLAYLKYILFFKKKTIVAAHYSFMKRSTTRNKSRYCIYINFQN